LAGKEKPAASFRMRGVGCGKKVGSKKVTILEIKGQGTTLPQQDRVREVGLTRQRPSTDAGHSKITLPESEEREGVPVKESGSGANERTI